MRNVTEVEEKIDTLSQRSLIPFHLGSFIGPYNGGGFPIVFPILQQVYQVDQTTLSIIVPAYFVTFGICQVFSGIISDLTSRHRVLLAGFTAFGVAALICAASPNLKLFVFGCLMLGVANAFTTPILLATLGDTLPPRDLPRTVALFSTANQSGHLLGPLVAGILATWSWRWFFVSVALLSWVSGILLLRWFHQYGQRVPTRPKVTSLQRALKELLSALNRRVVQVILVTFFANAAIMGTAYLLGQALRDLWQLNYATIGLIVSLYGLGAILFGPATGSLLERFGLQRGAQYGILWVGGMILVMTLAPHPVPFGAGYLGLGLAAMLTWTAISTLAVQAAPDYRGTASAWFLSARFLVQGLAPALYTPIYSTLGPRAVFGVSAVIAFSALVPLALLRSRSPLHTTSPSIAVRGGSPADSHSAQRTCADPPDTATHS